MKLNELHTILLAEHSRERKIFLRNTFFALFFWMLFLILIYTFINKSSASSLFEKIINSYKGLTAQSEYYALVVPLAILSTLAYPIILFKKYITKPKVIKNLIALLEEKKQAEMLTQTTVYKTTIPLYFINFKIDPFEILNFSIGKDFFSITVPLSIVPQIKAILSGSNIEKVNDLLNDLATNTETIENVNKKKLETLALKPLSEFQSFADKNIYSIAADMNKGRSSSNNLTKVLLFIIFIFIVAAAFFIYKIATSESSFFEKISSYYATHTIEVVGVIFLGLTVFSYLYMFITKKLVPNTTHSYSAFNEKIFREIVQFINPSFQYIKHGHAGIGDLNDSILFHRKNYLITGDNQIIGNHLGNLFQFCNLNLQLEEGIRDKNEAPDLIFQGQYVSTKTTKTMNANILVKAKTSLMKTIMQSDLKSYLHVPSTKLSLGKKSIMDTFDIFCEDKNTALQILTPQFLNAIEKLNEKCKGNLYIAFLGNRIELALETNEVKFKPQLSTEIDTTFIDNIYTELYSQLEFLENFKTKN